MAGSRRGKGKWDGGENFERVVFILLNTVEFDAKNIRRIVVSKKKSVDAGLGCLVSRSWRRKFARYKFTTLRRGKTYAFSFFHGVGSGKTAKLCFFTGWLSELLYFTDLMVPDHQISRFLYSYSVETIRYCLIKWCRFYF